MPFSIGSGIDLTPAPVPPVLLPTGEDLDFFFRLPLSEGAICVCVCVCEQEDNNEIDRSIKSEEW